MDLLPPELWNLIACNDLVTFDKLRATSKSVSGWLTEPPIMIADMPIDNRVVWDEHCDYSKISRGGVKLHCYPKTRDNDGCVVYRSGLKTAARIFLNYDGLAPVFVEATRTTPGTKIPVLSMSTDVRFVMCTMFRRCDYDFDVNISTRSVYFHISRFEEMLASGQWKFFSIFV